MKLELNARDHDTHIVELEASVGSVLTRMAYLEDKCEGMESRMRRNNINLIGVPEGSEGPQPTEYVAKLPQELLSLAEKPLLDRAHHSLHSRPRDGELLGPFVIRVHFFHIHNEILKKSGEALPIIDKGRRNSVFPDYTTLRSGLALEL